VPCTTVTTYTFMIDGEGLCGDTADAQESLPLAVLRAYRVAARVVAGRVKG